MLERFHVPVADRVYVDEAPMRAATEDIFRAMGLSDEDAVLCADVLLFNDIRGVESHGVSNMLRNYVGEYRNGRLNPRPSFTIERESTSSSSRDRQWEHSTMCESMWPTSSAESPSPHSVTGVPM